MTTTTLGATDLLQLTGRGPGPSVSVVMRDRMTARAIRRSKARRTQPRRAPQATQTPRKGFGA